MLEPGQKESWRESNLAERERARRINILTALPSFPLTPCYDSRAGQILPEAKVTGACVCGPYR